MLLRNHIWEMHPGNVGKHLHIKLTKGLVCYSVQWLLRQSIISNIGPDQPGKIKAGSPLFGKGILILQIPSLKVYTDNLLPRSILLLPPSVIFVEYNKYLTLKQWNRLGFLMICKGYRSTEEMWELKAWVWWEISISATLDMPD